MKKLLNFEMFSVFENYSTNEDATQFGALPFSPDGPISWNNSTKTFSVYSSDIGLKSYPSKEVSISYLGKIIKFVQTGVDKDGSGEDVYGWRYDSVEGSKFPCKLLIIND